MASRDKSHKNRVYAFGRNRIVHLETSDTKSKPNRQHAYCQRATRTSEKLRVERSTPRKHGLIRLIAEARAPVFRERLERAMKTGRYPALRGDIDNPHKKAQRIRELYQLKDEVIAALRAQKYEQEIEKNPRKRLKIL